MESIAADLQEIRLGTQVFQVWVPNFQALQESYQSQACGDAPFWGRVWPSALAMICFMEQYPQYIQGKKVLELAAGLGLPSFYASQFASDTIVSDYAADAVKWMDKNIQLNNLVPIQAKQINWNHLPQDLKVETLLLCDVNYDSKQFEALLQMIQYFLKQGTTILLATPQRLIGRDFINILLNQALVNEVIEIYQDDQLHLINLLVLATDKNFSENAFR
jgi:predicted nicotinamide N-methyase